MSSLSVCKQNNMTGLRHTGDRQNGPTEAINRILYTTEENFGFNKSMGNCRGSCSHRVSEQLHWVHMAARESLVERSKVITSLGNPANPAIQTGNVAGR